MKLPTVARALRGAVAALVATGMVLTIPAARASVPRIEGPFGTGAAEVWLVQPPGPVRAIVIFGHGWKEAPPSTGAPWVKQFRPWLDHLARRGDAVIFPRYQLGGDATGAARARSFRAGLQTAFAQMPGPPIPVIAIGYSYGASLAFTYAANARTWQLPTPTAVDVVFPASPIPGFPLPHLARTTRVLVEVGDADTVAGSVGADAFWRWLGGAAPFRRYAVVRSHGAFVADHAAPKATTPAARAAFWAPLDRLIAVAAVSG